MTLAWGEATLLVELVDRQFSYLLTLQGTSRLIRLPRLLAFLAADARIADLLADFRDEAVQARQVFRRVDFATRRELGRFWAEHRAEIQARLKTVADDVRNVAGAMEGYADRLETKYAVVLPDPGVVTDRERETTQLILALSHWQKCVIDRTHQSTTQPSEGLDALGRKLSRLTRAYEFASRCLREASESLAWPAYRRLVRYAKFTNPKPPNSDSLLSRFKHDQDRKLAKALVGADEEEVSLVDKHDVDEIYRALDADAGLLHQELRHQIGVGRSRLSVVQRYAAKCEGFDADDLRARCRRDSANAERHLTLHFARYVFDQGLLPLIDPTIGGLRPDVMHVGAGDPLYVEAKQYSGPHPKSTLQRAYNQVWSTLSRIRKVYPVAEAFLVIFRRGGPLVELPARLKYDGLTLHSVLTDISAKGGSKETAQVIRIQSADLRPK